MEEMNGKNRVLAFDIGGTFTKYGLYDIEDGIKEISRGKVPTDVSIDGFLPNLFKIVDIVRNEGNDFEGIGVSIPGFVNPITGENTDFSIPMCFTHNNVKDELMRYAGVPVVMENDSNCAAIAEQFEGAGAGAKSFVMVTVGTGLGAAIVLNNKLYRGSSFKAGELGFSIVANGDRAGATSELVARVSEYVRMTGSDDEVNGEYVFKTLNNRQIRKIYEEWVYEAAQAIGNFAAVLDVERILIGGGISEEKRFTDDLRKKLNELYMLNGYTELVACKLGNDAGKVGAAILFREYRKEAD